MKSKQKEIAECECRLYDKAIGIVSTLNTFYPFNVGMKEPLLVFEDILEQIQVDHSVMPQFADRAGLISEMKNLQTAFCDNHIQPDNIAKQLMGLYVRLALATHQIQDRFNITTPLWGRFKSRLDGIVFGWTLGWGDEKRISLFKEEIIEMYNKMGVRL